VLAVACGPACAPARADGSAAPARRADPAPGGLDPALLARAPIVVLGRVGWVRPGIGGAQHLVRVDVARTLRGRSVGRTLTLFLAGPPAEADARQRGRLEGQEGRAYVLFLSPTRHGSGWQIEALFSAEAGEGAEKAALLEGELAEDAGPGARARRVSRLLEALAKGGVWTRAQAASLLRALAEADAAGFPPSARGEARAALASTGDARVRGDLSALLERLGPAPGESSRDGRPGDLDRLRRHFGEAQGDDARCLALTTLAREGGPGALGDLLAAAADPSPRVRERAAVLAGDVAAARALPALLGRFPAEPDAAVREAIVRCAGLARGLDLVPWLVLREREEPTRRAALYALARVGGADADAALAAARVSALSRVPPDRGTARLVDYLRGPEFEEAERAAGRPRPTRAPPREGDATEGR
jgi:hypothetical protein